MSGVLGGQDSGRRGLRRKMREERERQRKLTLRHRWYAGGIATLLSGALIFSGVGPAMAEEVSPTPAPEQTTATEPPADDAAQPPAEPPAEESPAPSPSESDPAPSPEPTQPVVQTPDLLPSDSGDLSVGDQAKIEQGAPDVGVLLVPAPGPTTAVITVKVGSDRTSITGVTNLAGVVLLLNTGANSPSGTRPDGVAGTADGWAKCTSDADGDCSFTVPNTQPGGV